MSKTDKETWSIPFNIQGVEDIFQERYRGALLFALREFQNYGPITEKEAVTHLLSAIWKFGHDEFKRGLKTPEYPLTPIETLYGFMSFVQSLPKKVTIGGAIDNTEIVELIKRFATANGLSMICTEGWHKLLKPIDLIPSDQETVTS